MFDHIPLLSLMIWTPLLGAIITLFVGKKGHDDRARWAALITALIGIIYCIPAYIGFNNADYHMQFQEHLPWITDYGIYYALGVDGISLPLIFLTSITTLVVVLAGWQTITFRVGQYMASFLVMSSMVIGVFA